jgi:hypothetical protein
VLRIHSTASLEVRRQRPSKLDANDERRMAKGGGSEVGTTKHGKGMKIMAIVDRHGLPLSVSTHAANHHEVRLVQLCFGFYMIGPPPDSRRRGGGVAAICG